MTKAIAVSWLAQRRIRFKGDSPGSRLLVEQLRDLSSGDHDDDPDALDMAVRLGDEMLSQVQIQNLPKTIFVLVPDLPGWF